MEVFDFFCGAGGLTRGLLDVGFDVIAGFDADAACKETYESNNPSSRFVTKDIRELTLQSLRVYAKSSLRDTCFVGCAPCQPFSQHRKEKSVNGDETLLGVFGKLVEEAKPRFVLAENVPGMARVKGFSTFKRFIQTLQSNNYTTVYSVLDAKDFGVPQTRKRLVVIAIRGDEIRIPLATHGHSRRPYLTVRDAIAHFSKLSQGGSDPKIPNHCAAKITEINMERLRHTPHDGGDRRSWPKSLILDCHKGGYTGHTDVYGRLAWDLPSPTLTARCNSISNGRYGHPSQDRAISLREAAALQSFPDRYKFFGSNKHIAQQIGNAVPVVFAEALGKHIKKLAS